MDTVVGASSTNDFKILPPLMIPLFDVGFRHGSVETVNQRRQVADFYQSVDSVMEMGLWPEGGGDSPSSALILLSPARRWRSER